MKIILLEYFSYFLVFRRIPTYHVSQTQSGKEVEIFGYRILFTHPYDRKNVRIFATLLLNVSYLDGMCDPC